jgi:hypothetical protein
MGKWKSKTRISTFPQPRPPAAQGKNVKKNANRKAVYTKVLTPPAIPLTSTGPADFLPEQQPHRPPRHRSDAVYTTTASLLPVLHAIPSVRTLVKVANALGVPVEPYMRIKVEAEDLGPDLMKILGSSPRAPSARGSGFPHPRMAPRRLIRRPFPRTRLRTASRSCNSAGCTGLSSGWAGSGRRESPAAPPGTASGSAPRRTPRR